MKDEYINKVRMRAIIVIFAIQMFLVSIAYDNQSFALIIPIITLPSLIFIILMFNKAKKANRLLQISPGIVALGFTLYLITSILRSVLANIMEDLILMLSIMETADLIVYIIIGIGFIRPSSKRMTYISFES